MSARVMIRLFLVLLILGIDESALALRYPRTIADISRQVDVIVMGRVLSLEPQWTEGRDAIHTRGIIAVAEILKGKVDGQFLEFQYNGGNIGNRMMGQEDGVSLFEDESVVLFLNSVRGDRLWANSCEETMYYGQGGYFDTDTRNRLRRDIQQALSLSAITEPPLLSAGKVLSASVSSVEPNQETGVDPYSYLILHGSDLGASGQIRFRQNYATNSWTNSRSTTSYPALFAEWSSTRVKFWPAGRAGGTSPSFMNGISSGPVQVYNGSSWVTSPDSFDVKYTYTHWKWPIATAHSGIDYWINATNFPGGSASYDTAAARQAIQAGFNAWAGITGTDLAFTFKGYRSDQSGTNVIYWNNVGYTALAHWDGTSSGNMTDCDIELDTDDAWLNANTTNLKETVMHEVGHLLGLGDLGGVADSVAQRLMFIRAPYQFSFSSPDADTQDGARRVYGWWSGELSPELGVSVWPDTIRLSGNVTVPSGDTLVMDGGSLYGVLVPEGYTVKSTGGIITGNSNAVTVNQTVPQKTALYPAWQSYSPTPGYYLIKYGTSTGSYSSFELVSNGTTSKVLSGLTNGTQYYLKVNGSSEFTNKPSKCRSDFDGDSLSIDFDDFFLLADHWGLSQGQGGYEQKYDLSGNTTVDSPDTVVFNSDFGQICGTQVPKVGTGLLAFASRNGDGQAGLQTEQVGEELVVNVQLKKLSEVSGLGFILDYDAGAISLTRIENLSRAFARQGEEGYLTAVSRQNGRLMAAVALKRGYESLKDPEIAVTVRFKAVGEGTGAPPVTLSEAVVADGNRTVDCLVGNTAGGSGGGTSDTGEYGLETQPNPFNPSTTIGYALPFEGKVTLEIYDVLGQLVRTLMTDEPQPAGRHTVVWDGRNQAKAAAASGTYVVRLQAGGRVQSQKITLVR